MDEPARKKRRTLSPRERDRSSSPLKKPPRRPSFASPTKASLARFNPDLIPSVLRKQSGSALGRGKQGRASIFNLQSGHIPGSQPAHGKDIQAKEGAAQATSLGYREPAASSNRTQAAEGREQELELPTSSSPRAMEYGSPRRGTLFSSPTKRPPRKAVHVRSKPAKSRQDGEQRTTAREDQTDHTALKWEAPNPELERKKREKEKLLRELEELEKDISQSVDWIRTLQRGTHARLSRQEQDKIISFINKVDGSDIPAENERLPPISSLLTSFLPYQVRPISPPPKQDNPEDPIPSYQPVELEDPLPYLQLFTPFKCTSRILLPDSGDLDPELKAWGKKMTFDIEGPQNAFTSSIEATIDTRDHRVVELRVSWSSNWSATELLKYIRIKEQERDLGSISWALGSYWELAKKRAIHWHKCETEFAHLIAGRTSEDKENFTRGNGKLERNMSRKDLLRYLGRDDIVLQNKHVHMKLSWRIGFDWTGDAETTLLVEPAYPRVWSEADEDATLRTIPETFHSLVQMRGVFEATKIIVALLFED